MKKYQFTGHLSPTPEGMMPLQMSGEVYLAAEVDALLRTQRKALINLAARFVTGNLMPNIDPEDGWCLTTPAREVRRINKEIDTMLEHHKVTGMDVRKIADTLLPT